MKFCDCLRGLGVLAVVLAGVLWTLDARAADYDSVKSNYSATKAPFGCSPVQPSVTKTGATGMDVINAFAAAANGAGCGSNVYSGGAVQSEGLDTWSGVVACNGGTGTSCAFPVSGSFTRSCPGGGTLQTVAPYKCLQADDENEALCAAMAGTKQYLTVKGQVTPGADVCTILGCKVTWTGMVIRFQDKETGVWQSEGEATFKNPAETCGGNPDDLAVRDECPNGTTAQVNGVSVCGQLDPNRNVIQSVKSTSTTTTTTTSTPSGTTTVPSTTTKNETTTCDAGKCSTTTTNTTSSGGTTTTTSSNTDRPTTDYCKDNPSAPGCTKSGFTGSCDATFACEGDAVMCATAAAVNKQLCAMTPSDQGTEVIDSVKESLQTSTLALSTVPLSSGSFDRTELLGAAQCVPDVSTVVWGKSVTLPISSICTQLAWLGNALIGVSLLLAARIVTRG